MISRDEVVGFPVTDLHPKLVDCCPLDVRRRNAVDEDAHAIDETLFSEPIAQQSFDQIHS